MPHLQKQVEFGTWIVVEGDGLEYVDASLVGLTLAVDSPVTPDSPLWLSALSAVRDYVTMFPETVSSIRMRDGWGARLSAPGYMDCTDWAVFDTEEEAADHLACMCEGG